MVDHLTRMLRIIFFMYCVISPSTSKLSPDSEMVQALLDPAVYDKGERPGAGGRPVNVEIGLLITSLGPVDSMKMDITAGFTLRQQWIDQRMAFNRTDDRTSSIELGSEYLHRIWVPDLYFLADKKSKMNDVTVPNVRLTLSPDGTVFLAVQITSTLNCLMDLKMFPHDKQKCAIGMMSYGHLTSDIIFKWSSSRFSPTSSMPSSVMTEFYLSRIENGDCTTTYETGTYSCLEAILHVERESGYYLIQTYLPSMLITALSWAGFWIDHRAVPARISVGLLTVLTIITQRAGVLATLSKVSYIKAIDIWMFSNLVFVFAAYLQFAVITVASRRYKQRHTTHNEKQGKEQDQHPNGTTLTVCLDDQSTGNGLRDKTPGSQKDQPRKKTKAPPQDTGDRIDVHSRYLFPLVYVVFIGIYWYWFAMH